MRAAVAVVVVCGDGGGGGAAVEPLGLLGPAFRDEKPETC